MTKILSKFALAISSMWCLSSGYATTNFPNDLWQDNFKPVGHNLSGFEISNNEQNKQVDLKGSQETPKQINKVLTEDEINNVHKAMFSRHILQNIFSHLGRQETGRMLQVSKTVNKVSQEPTFWLNIAKRSQIKIVGSLTLHNIQSQVKNYYTVEMQPLFNDTYRYIRRIKLYQRGRLSGIFVNFDGSRLIANVVDRLTDKKTAVIGTRAEGQSEYNMQPLFKLNRGKHGNAIGMSADGTIIVGWARDDQNNNQTTAVIWNEQGIIQSLGMLRNRNFSEATGISADGTIVVGWANDGQNNNRTMAVIWKREEGQSEYKIQSLDMLGNVICSIAEGVSADGTIVVG